MKKIIFALLTLCMASATQAAAPVPETIKHDFVELFPQATNMVWTEQKEGFYEVDFTFNQQSYAALIDRKGTMLHAGKTLTWFQYPASVRKTISTNYQGFHMKVMLKENDHYFAEFAQNGVNYMVLLDNTGKVISSSKE